MKAVIDYVLSQRLRALFLKELRQLKRNRRLVVLLVIPPTLNLILFGTALNPQVKNLRLGTLDESRTQESRELVSAFIESGSFALARQYLSLDELSRDLETGEIDAGLIVPEDFASRRARRETAEVQLLLDAVDTNTATIAGGYAARIIGALNQRIASTRPRNATAATVPAPPIQLTQQALPPPPRASIQSNVAPPRTPQITPRVALLYNPGLRNSWFIVTGLIGTLLVLQGSLVAAASMVREKEVGTIEQLLMTPAEAYEIITAKIAPIFLLLTADIGLSLMVGRIVFGVPVRGSLLLLFLGGMFCILSGIGLGTLLATFTRSQQQAQLMGFFVNPPVAMLSGAMTPIEAMPAWLQPITYINPVRHFGTVARGVMLKGVGLDVLYPEMLALSAFAFILVAVSAWRFRKQLG